MVTSELLEADHVLLFPVLVEVQILHNGYPRQSGPIELYVDDRHLRSDDTAQAYRKAKLCHIKV